MWKVYREAVTDVDNDMLDGWTDTLNILLTFVSEFSASATILNFLRPVSSVRSKPLSSSSRKF